MKAHERMDTRQLCLKVSAGAYEELEMRAGSQDMATTSLARWYVLEQLGMTDQFVKQRTGKRRVAIPFSQETNLKIALLRELQLIRLNLELMRKDEAERTNGQKEHELADVLECAKQVFKSILAKHAGQGA